MVDHLPDPVIHFGFTKVASSRCDLLLNGDMPLATLQPWFQLTFQSWPWNHGALHGCETLVAPSWSLLCCHRCVADAESLNHLGSLSKQSEDVCNLLNRYIVPSCLERPIQLNTPFYGACLLEHTHWLKLECKIQHGAVRHEGFCTEQRLLVSSG